MSKMDWEKANFRERQRRKKATKRRTREAKAVHPNSMAAKKWKRKFWN